MPAYFTAIRLHRLLLLLCFPVLLGMVFYVATGRAEHNTRPLSGWLIAVDAGHGGHDKGAWFPTHELVEKDINLHTARDLAHILARDGAAVVLIRDDDTFVQLGDRARKANELKARMFVSIHVNRYPEDKSCCGAQVFHGDSAPGRRLAELVQQQLCGIDPNNNRTALPGNYKVLRDSQMPAILVEIGFATNSRDRELILDPHYRRNVAYSIRNAVLQFAVSEPAGGNV